MTNEQSVEGDAWGSGTIIVSVFKFLVFIGVLTPHLKSKPVSQNPVCHCKQQRESLAIYSARESTQVVLTDQLSTWVFTSTVLRREQGSSAQ